MRKIILTLAISLALLTIASVIFSLEKKSAGGREVNSQRYSAKLPTSNNALTASLNPNFIPIRNWAIEDPDIKAKAFGVFDLSGNKFLYQKNIKEELPIASLTKIMTAIIALENIGLDNIITISKNAVMTEGENGQLVIEESLSARDLLYIMLIESSNDAAAALAGTVDNFVFLMNEKTKEIGLENTNFDDAFGISKKNYSTISDLSKLGIYSFSQKSLIWQILSIKEAEIISQDGKIKHQLKNTNKLLGELANMLAGKTGFTEEAGGCMLTISNIPNKTGGYLITIVLGSENRELDTKKLIEWVESAYVW